MDQDSPQGVTIEEETALKTYHGLAATEDHASTVTVRDRRSPKKLGHHVRHSPTGFNWGYGGSGPADLARSLLFDAFGQPECPPFPSECECRSKWVDSTYQAFKSDIVSKLTQDQDWKLVQMEVCEWVFDYLDVGSPEQEPASV